MLLIIPMTVNEDSSIYFIFFSRMFISDLESLIDIEQTKIASVRVKGE